MWINNWNGRKGFGELNPTNENSDAKKGLNATWRESLEKTGKREVLYGRYIKV